MIFSNCPQIYQTLPSLFNLWIDKTIHVNLLKKLRNGSQKAMTRNDQKRKLFEFAGITLEELNFWWVLAIWNHCALLSRQRAPNAAFYGTHSGHSADFFLLLIHYLQFFFAWHSEDFVFIIYKSFFDSFKMIMLCPVFAEIHLKNQKHILIF